jgi:acyl-CoA thioester hydrolase
VAVRHRYECPLRWADLDLLGHVNNVTYVDYLQEARVDMLRVHAPDSRAEDLAEGVVVVRHEVEYLRPLEFRHRPVTIESWVTEVRAASFTMAYEILDEEPGGGRTTYLRAWTVLTPYVFAEERPRRLSADERTALQPFLEPEQRTRPEPWTPVPATAEHYPVHVRFSDVDVYGHVNNVTYYTYFQEARIRLFDRLAETLGDETSTGRMVVARIDVDYKVPILFRSEPYDLRTRVSRIGRTSVTLDSEIRDADSVLSRARVVVVFWDPRAESPVEPSPRVRQLLESEQVR